MAKEKPEQLSKSSFGAYEPLYPETKLDQFMYRFFVKKRPLRASINLIILTGLIVFSFLGVDFAPWNRYLLFIWIGLLMLINFIGLVYWRKRVKKLDQEIVKIERELLEIKKELTDRQKVFNEIKKEMLDQN